VNEIVKESKSRGVTFLTAVAGTAVLGVEFAILTPFMTVAASLKPSLEVAINRSWLLVSWEFCTISTLLSAALHCFSGRQERGGFPLLVIVGFWRHVVVRDERLALR